jgi:hypothetical protein
MCLFFSLRRARATSELFPKRLGNNRNTLAICQVSDELVELIGAVDEVGVFDDFAKYEGIFPWRPYYAD